MADIYAYITHKDGVADDAALELAAAAQKIGAGAAVTAFVSDVVGIDGQTVKPKVYLACGISGSFQHMGGIKGSPFIVAINKNVKAPIFQVADVGIEADILDFLPELTSQVKAL